MPGNWKIVLSVVAGVAAVGAGFRACLRASRRITMRDKIVLITGEGPGIRGAWRARCRLGPKRSRARTDPRRVCGSADLHRMTKARPNRVRDRFKSEPNYRQNLIDTIQYHTYRRISRLFSQSQLTGTGTTAGPAVFAVWNRGGYGGTLGMAKTPPDLNASNARLAATQARFVLAELEMAITFCGLALSTDEASTRRRNIENAIKGYRTALRFSKVPGHNLEEQEEFQEKLDNLTALLLRLGQKIEDLSLQPNESAFGE